MEARKETFMEERRLFEIFIFISDCERKSPRIRLAISRISVNDDTWIRGIADATLEGLKWD